MKRGFAAAGAAVGFLFGVGILIAAYRSAPGAPGMFELIFQMVIVVFLAAIGAGAGLLLGSVVDLFLRRK